MKKSALNRLARWASIAAFAVISAGPLWADSPLTERIYEDAQGVAEDGPGRVLSPDEWAREFPQLRQSGQDSTNVRNTMISGRLEWNPGQWSDCEVTSIPYCGTYQGIQRRPITCVLGSIKGTSSTQNDAHCIGGVGPKPPTTRSCTLVVNTDCTPPPAVVSVTADPGGQLLANGSDTARLTAIMRHANGTRAAGEDVTWSANRGTLSATKTTTNSNGETSVTLRSSSIGSSRITASSYASSAVANVEFISSVPNLVSLSASPSSGLIVGRDTSTVSARLQYGNGRAASGYTVNFDTTRGSLNTSRRTTDSAGNASVVLQSNSAGSASVTARSEGSTRDTTVSFVALVPSVTAVSASPSSGVSANGSAFSTITATVKYQTGEPAANQPVTFSTNLGSLSATTLNTNSAGQASVTIRSTSTGTATVRASNNNGSRSTNVGFVMLGETAYGNGPDGVSKIRWRRSFCHRIGNVMAEINPSVSMWWKATYSDPLMEYYNPFANASGIYMGRSPGWITSNPNTLFEDANYTYRAGRLMVSEYGCPPGQVALNPPYIFMEWEVVRTPK